MKKDEEIENKTEDDLKLLSIDDQVAESNKNQLKRNKEYLASASDDETIKIWDLDTFQCLKTLQGHDYSVRSIQFLGKGLIASAGGDGKIKIWDISTGECNFTIDAHSGWINALELLDKETLVSGSDDGTIKA